MPKTLETPMVTNPSVVHQLQKDTQTAQINESHIYRVGVSWNPNRFHRESMEDEHGFDLTFCHQEQGLFYVIDGHGGKETANFVTSHLSETIRSVMHENPQMLIEHVFVKAFQKLDENIAKSGIIKSGACIAVCLIRKEKDEDGTISNILYTANTGDTRAVLSRSGKAIRLSRDHKAADVDEQSRVIESGGKIQNGRVNARFNISRALGDIQYKSQMISTPHVTAIILDETTDSHLIIACDGIFDVLSDQDVVNIALQSSNVQEASKNIVQKGIKQGTTDNMTCMVVEFKKFHKQG